MCTVKFCMCYRRSWKGGGQGYMLVEATEWKLRRYVRMKKKREMDRGLRGRIQTVRAQRRRGSHDRKRLESYEPSILNVQYQLAGLKMTSSRLDARGDAMTKPRREHPENVVASRGVDAESSDDDLDERTNSHGLVCVFYRDEVSSKSRGA